MNQLIGQSKITDSIIILVPVEVVAISTESLTQTMRVIEH